ncbi:MAG: hypothetical protein M3025_05695, partial [Actinomycetota bacterium]|nr:hypothetical protein [Actinomycetota bacterium]
VCFSVSSRDGMQVTASTHLPGGRFDIRDRSTTVAMHMLRGHLIGRERPGTSHVRAGLG